MPLRLAHAGDFHLDEDRYFADTAQCLEWFVADAIRASVDLFVINGGLRRTSPIHNMRQGEGIRYETRFRDETAGALDAVNGKEYVRTLRRGMGLGGFHQILFICHSPLVWEFADSILSVCRGRVMIGDHQTAPI
jgi:hypothetical protein